MPTLSCILIPKLSLLAACQKRERLLKEPLAVAPETPTGAVGEVSPVAEGKGVREGMGMSEAIGICPELQIIPPNPVGIRRVMEQVADAVEGIGAQIEIDVEMQTAWFDVEQLTGIYGSTTKALEHAHRAIIRADRLCVGVRFGLGTSKFVAHIAATHGQRVSPTTHAITSRSELDTVPITALSHHKDVAELIPTLQRLGLITLGDIRSAGSSRMTERFGFPGKIMWRFTTGIDRPLHPRTPADHPTASMNLPQQLTTMTLTHGFEVLIRQLVGDPVLSGRLIRKLRVEAHLCSGGTWECSVVLREPTVSIDRIHHALLPVVDRFPAPIDQLHLVAEEHVDPVHQTEQLFGDQTAIKRRQHLVQAIHQARIATTEHAVLKVINVNPDSRFPERRAILVPYPVDEVSDG